jgi:hypothetical protein
MEFWLHLDLYTMSLWTLFVMAREIDCMCVLLIHPTLNFQNNMCVVYRYSLKGDVTSELASKTPKLVKSKSLEMNRPRTKFQCADTRLIDR